MAPWHRRRDEDLEAVLTATVEAAEKSVARTPTPRDPARGRRRRFRRPGLYRLFQGALLHLVEGGRRSPRPTTEAAAASVDARRPRRRGLRLRDDVPAPGDAGPPDRHRRLARALRGDRRVGAGRRGQQGGRVHCPRNDRPDLVIGHGLTLGTLSRISVENLDNQAQRRARGARRDCSPLPPNWPKPRPMAARPALTTGRGRLRPLPWPSSRLQQATASRRSSTTSGSRPTVRRPVRHPSTGELLEAIERPMRPRS